MNCKGRNKKVGLDKAYRYIESLKKEINDRICLLEDNKLNRKVVSELLRKDFNQYLREALSNVVYSEHGENVELFRARIYNKFETPKYGEKFEGYNEKDSFVNINKLPGNTGRFDYSNRITLYAAGDENTSILEISPSLYQYVNVAKILIKEELKLVDLYTEYSLNNDFYREIITLLRDMVTSSNNDYIFTQYVAELVVEMGFDGICFKSKYRNSRDYINRRVGKNYAIFSYHKCEAISSKIVLIEDIDVKKSDITEEYAEKNNLFFE